MDFIKQCTTYMQLWDTYKKNWYEFSYTLCSVYAFPSLRVGTQSGFAELFLLGGQLPEENIQY